MKQYYGTTQEHCSKQFILCFPLPLVTGHDSKEPISIKRLMEGDGAWLAQKEVLDWIVDGIKQCIQLPKKKVKNLLSKLHQTSQGNQVTQKSFESLHGCLQHACIGIPTCRGLMGPIDNAHNSDKQWIGIKANKLLCSSLQDFHTIIMIMGKCPTFC
jgi:hypothetical protein